MGSRPCVFPAIGRRLVCSRLDPQELSETMMIAGSTCWVWPFSDIIVVLIDTSYDG